MMKESFFQSKAQAESLIQGRVIAVVTEYTIFKLDLEQDRVIFGCLQNIHSFSIPFQLIQGEIKASKRDFSEAFLETLVTYCSVVSPHLEKRAYPLCEFKDMDDLLDWFLDWQAFEEEERIEYLEQL